MVSGGSALRSKGDWQLSMQDKAREPGLLLEDWDGAILFMKRVWGETKQEDGTKCGDQKRNHPIVQ